MQIVMGCRPADVSQTRCVWQEYCDQMDFVVVMKGARAAAVATAGVLGADGACMHPEAQLMLGQHLRLQRPAVCDVTI